MVHYPSSLPGVHRVLLMVLIIIHQMDVTVTYVVAVTVMQIRTVCVYVRREVTPVRYILIFLLYLLLHASKYNHSADITLVLCNIILFITSYVRPEDTASTRLVLKSQTQLYHCSLIYRDNCFNKMYMYACFLSKFDLHQNPSCACTTVMP